MSSPSEPRFHETDRGYLAHWRRVGPLLESIQREETRRHGAQPNDGQVVDSLLQLGYLHRDPDRRPISLIHWQARFMAAQAKQMAAQAKQKAAQAKQKAAQAKQNAVSTQRDES